MRSGGDKPRSDLIAHRLVATGTTALILNQKCELFKRTGGGSSERTSYISKLMDWSILKETSKGPWPGARIDYDTTFEQHSSELFIPSRWEVRTVFKDNSASMTKKFAVVAQSINRPLPKDAFEVTFPVGATVFDDKFSKGIAAEVQPDGSYKPHPASNPDDLIAFEKSQRAEQLNRINYWLLGIGVVLVFLGILATLVRAKRRRSITSPITNPNP